MTLTLFVFLFLFKNLTAQYGGSFLVGGDPNLFYPVTFIDRGWPDNVPTELTIGRSNVHTDATWRGSVLGVFNFHVTNWGNGSQFIDAKIAQYAALDPKPFIGGWKDATSNNSSSTIIIWLRGSTTYFYHSNYDNLMPTPYVSTAYYEIVENATNIYHGYKTAPDPYVNSTGISTDFTAYFNGTGTNYFGGNIAIGTYDPKGYRLAVNGAAIFTKVVVKPYPWPDYVFNKGYRLRPLSEVEQYIQQHHHLPEVPAADEVEKNGVEVGNNQAVLLKKIEELTLYVIEQQKNQQKTDQRLGALEKENKQLKKLLHKK